MSMDQFQTFKAMFPSPGSLDKNILNLLVVEPEVWAGQGDNFSVIFPLQCVMVLEQAPFSALARQQSATTTLAKSPSREEQFRGLDQRLAKS